MTNYKPVAIPVNEQTYPTNSELTTDEIQALYFELRRDAQRLNASRAYYVNRSVKLQQELEVFAQNSQLVLADKARLNALVGRYADVFDAFETAGDDLVAGITNYDKGARPYGGGSPIRRLLTAARAFMAAWKAAKDLSANIQDTNNGLLS